jgi:hypothetical protein
MIQASLVYDGGRSRMPCVIRNLSDTGAKIEVSSVAKVPRTFDLVVDRVRPQSCVVVWRAVKELGVQFQS